MLIILVFMFSHSKVKFPLEEATKAQRGSIGMATLSLTSALDGGGWSMPHTGRLLHPWERTCTHCIGGWVGPRMSLDGCGKSRPPPGFDPWTVQPIPSRYTDWAIPAHIFIQQAKQRIVQL